MYKVEPVLMRAKSPPTVQTGKLPDTGPCSVLEDNKKHVLLRRTTSKVKAHVGPNIVFDPM
jgi:hypothetical protein